MTAVFWSFLLAGVAVIVAQTDYNSPPSCVVKPIDLGSATGEALAKAVTQAYARLVLQMDVIAAANQGKPLNNDTGFFLSVILEGDQNIRFIQDMGTGVQPINEDNCLDAALFLGNRTADFTTQVINHVHDVIPGACDKLTGEQRYQYVLQQVGQVFIQIGNVVAANANNTNPGKCLQNFRGGNEFTSLLNSVNAGTAGAFNATACKIVLSAQAASVQLVRNSLTDNY